MKIKNSKKIGLLLYSLEAGGAERVASILATQLAKNHQIHLILFNGPIQYNLPENIQIKFLGKGYSSRLLRLLSLFTISFKLATYLKRHNLSILLSFDLLPNIINCVLPNSRKMPQKWLRVSSYPTARFSKANFTNYFSKALIRQFYPRASNVFVNARSIKTDLQDNFGLTLPMHLFPNPIDLKAIEQLKTEKLITKNKFIFIHLGNFLTVKNHQLLIEAFNKNRHFEVELWLIGKGPLKETIQEKVNQLKLTNQVKFFGYQSNPFPYLHHADCLVLSSNYEGFPNAILEGLACGLPIISTDCPSGPREIIAPKTDFQKSLKNHFEEVEFGLLTPVRNVEQLAKSMKRIYDHKGNNTFPSEKYRNRAKDFEVSKVIKKLETFL